MFRSARRAPRANPFNTRPAQGAVSAPHRFLGACVIPGRRTEVRLVDLHGVNETRRRVPQGVHRYSPDGTIWEPNTLCVREAAADGLLCDCVFFASLLEGHPVEFEGSLYRLCASAPRDCDNVDELLGHIETEVLVPPRAGYNRRHGDVGSPSQPGNVAPEVTLFAMLKSSHALPVVESFVRELLEEVTRRWCPCGTCDGLNCGNGSA